MASIRAARAQLALTWLLASSATAAGADTPVPPADPYAPFHAEVRGGYLVGISFPWDTIRAFPERGTGNLNAEFVLPQFFFSTRVPQFLLPRLHAGGTLNLEGRTSYAYGGFLWTANVTQRAFGEIFFGGIVHNGQVGDSNPRLSRLGCHGLYQVGANFGYHLSVRSSAMLTFDHGSDGEPTLSSCHSNEGINVLGVRFGYSFL